MSLLPVLLAFTGPSLPQEPFVDARNMLPHRVATTANAVATADVDLDGDADVLEERLVEAGRIVHLH